MCASRTAGFEVARRLRRVFGVGIAAALAVAGAERADAQWTQWGGPDRNFRVAPAPLASEWPASGPKILWRRTLGHGDSAIVADSETLYTMYRREDDHEVIVALERATGAPRWEYAYAAPLWPGFRANNGKGPRSTPIVVGDRVCAIGVGARLSCLDRRSGELLWTRDLWEHYQVDPGKFGPSDRGFAASPLALGNRLVTVAGGPGHAVTALDLDDGSVVWSSLDFEIAYASPIRIEVGGQPQLVFFLADRVVGVDPAKGALLWQHPHRTDFSMNASTPVFGPDGVLFVSSAYDVGSRALRLRLVDGRTEVEELWTNRKVHVMHGSAVRVGDVIWASSGGFGPAFLVGVRAGTGEELARMRGFAKANVVASGERLVILDEDGVLGLVSIESGQPVVLGRTPLLAPRAWVVPTLIGTTLYARDRQEIVAVELGR